MKKLTFIAAAAAALVLASCGNKAQQTSEEAADSVSFEQSQIEEKIMVELDSVANVWNELQPVEGVFQNGKIQLSEDELKAKPTYLLEPNAADNLSLLSQKYRAMGMLAVDEKVASLYKMDTDAYKAAITKLATDVNDPAVKAIDKPSVDDIKAFYTAEKDNGRINFFWEASAAALVENLYVISQNTDKFLPAFDDKTASDMTYHIALMKLSLNDLAQYDPDIKALVEILAPLDELNAISVDQLKGQLEKMKPEIDKSRGALLK